ncbi:hypothetical protein K2173_018124 [Erythroxylum novogranatense]|uniref:Uncharacterized protein n=1 Tax=Erythroxylum novogranatense TaxID=1862640 RepID=A0AAV8U6F0_9ROSI|nr:hypothetical protein K2173_018124 [Erythroxylum novogranatense]
MVFSEIQEIDDKEVSEYKVTEFGFGADSDSKNNEFMNSKETFLETRKKQVLAGSISSDKSHGGIVDGFYSRKVIFGSLKGMKKSLQIEVVDDTALIKPTVVPKFVNGGERNGKKEKQELDGKGKRPRRKGKHVKDVLGTSEIGEAPNDGAVKANGTTRKYNRKGMEDLRFVNIVEQRRLWAEIHRGLGHTVVNGYDEFAASKYENYRKQKKEDAPHFLGVAARGRRRNHFNIYVH